MRTSSEVKGPLLGLGKQGEVRRLKRRKNLAQIQALGTQKRTGQTWFLPLLGFQATDQRKYIVTI